MATYYISNAGSDSNNGLSKGAPWAHDPASVLFTGTYTHVAGDRIIFRGGDTWGAANFPIAVAVNGVSSSVLDYRGVDVTWFSGGSFVKPVFDGGLADISALSGNCMVHFTFSYQQLDSISFKNLAWANPVGNTRVVNLGAGDYVIVTNCDFSNIVDNCATLSGSDVLACIGGSTSGSVGTKVSHCTFTCLPNTSYCGTAIYYCDTWEYNTISNMANGFTGICTVCQFNSVTSIQHSVDVTAHENAIEIFIPPGLSYIHDNVIRNNVAGELLNISALDLLSTDTATVYVYNNLITDNFGTLTPAIQIDGSAPNGGHTGIRGNAVVWNNTLQDSEPSGQSQGYIRVVGRTGSQFATVTAQNNHFITEGSGLAQPDVGYVGTITENHELVESNAAATAAGYTTGNAWMPTVIGSPTVGVGTSAPSSIFTTSLNGVTRGASWDIGAYQFHIAGVSPSLSTVVSSPGSVAADGVAISTITVTLLDSMGSPVSGKTVTLAKTGGAGSPTFSPASGPSSVGGIVTFTVKSTTVATDTFTATDATDSIVITQTASITFTTPAASHPSVITPDHMELEETQILLAKIVAGSMASLSTQLSNAGYSGGTLATLKASMEASLRLDILTGLVNARKLSYQLI